MKITDVAKLDIPFEFGCDDDCMETVEMDMVFEQLDDTVETKWGASKFVILSDDWKDVVKIPFNGGFWWEQDDEDEDGGKYIFNEFITKDYCAEEAAIYADAVKHGVAQFFAKTVYGGMTNDGITPYYISERVCNFYDKCDKCKIASKDSLEKAKKAKSEICFEWLAMAYEWYGEDAVNALLKFIELEEIGDFHSGNVGFRADGSPVILDYSGFHEP